VEKAQKAVDAKRMELIETRRRKKTIEKLKEREQEAYKKVVVKEEQALIDETATLQYNSGKKPQ
jgi:flagellar export protein FliJ